MKAIQDEIGCVTVKTYEYLISGSQLIHEEVRMDIHHRLESVIDNSSWVGVKCAVSKRIMLLFPRVFE